MKVEVSTGELFDRITILQVKLKKLRNLDKLKAATEELVCLKEEARYIDIDENVLHKLHDVNEELWDLEDKIRQKGFAEEFDEEFIDTAWLIYMRNDLRSAYKDEINNLTGSVLKEIKQYAINSLDATDRDR